MLLNSFLNKKRDSAKIEFKNKEYNFTGTVWNGSNSANCSLSGSYPLNYNFTIEKEKK